MNMNKEFYSQQCRQNGDGAVEHVGRSTGDKPTSPERLRDMVTKSQRANMEVQNLLNLVTGTVKEELEVRSAAVLPQLPLAEAVQCFPDLHFVEMDRLIEGVHKLRQALGL